MVLKTLQDLARSHREATGLLVVFKRGRRYEYAVSDGLAVRSPNFDFRYCSERTRAAGICQRCLAVSLEPELRLSWLRETTYAVTVAKSQAYGLSVVCESCSADGLPPTCRDMATNVVLERKPFSISIRGKRLHYGLHSIFNEERVFEYVNTATLELGDSAQGFKLVTTLEPKLVQLEHGVRA